MLSKHLQQQNWKNYFFNFYKNNVVPLARRVLNRDITPRQLSSCRPLF